MPRVYDNWERLVRATLRREQLREIALRTPSDLSLASSSSFNFTAFSRRLSSFSLPEDGRKAAPFTFQELAAATKNFSPLKLLGVDGSGRVYRGVLESGKVVAVKKLDYNGLQGFREFLEQINVLSRLRHPNIVNLIGYCADGDHRNRERLWGHREECNERVLAYEYMDNGSLHDHLHEFQNSPLMSWAARIMVALDAARGIEYLHEYAVPQVIHCNIKSSNILLDTTWTAKVSDLGPQEESHLFLRAAGTVGYLDPESYRLPQLTTKSDVYSFGVVLLELLSGCRAVHKNEIGMPRNVVDFVVPYIVQDEIHRVLDKKVPSPTPFEIEAVAYVGYLAADCVTLEGIDRPTMTEIVNSLERALAACSAPPML